VLDVPAATRAAHLLAAARRGAPPLERLPADCRPASIPDAYLIQDQVTAALGPVSGWKVGVAKAGDLPTCAPLYSGGIYASGAALALDEARCQKLEIEFAFRLLNDIRPRSRPYDIDDTQTLVEFVPLIEVVRSRYKAGSLADPLEMLADANGNAAVVVGPPLRGFQGLDFSKLEARLTIDGTVVQSAINTHPLVNPLPLVVWQINHVLERSIPLLQGHIITTGSLQGASPIPEGGQAVGEWGGLGSVRVAIVP
jgi:2-keto-4-pentenoate hydratase